MAGLCPRTGGCGVSTVRVTPRATSQPCVYWPGAGEPLSLLLSLRSKVVQTPPFVEARTAPEACRSCVYLEPCYGGGGGRAPDPQAPRSAQRPYAKPAAAPPTTDQPVGRLA